MSDSVPSDGNVAEDASRGDDDILVSDAERDAAVRRLSDECAAGRLTLGEFEERIGGALGARTRRDVATVLVGLPVPVPPAAVPVNRGRAKLSVSAFGATRRSGHWIAPLNMVHVVLLGQSRLDLFDVELSGPEVRITIVSVLGGARVRLPESVHSEVTGVSLFGARQIDQSRPASPNAPLIRLKIYSIFGATRVESTSGRPR